MVVRRGAGSGGVSGRGDRNRIVSVEVSESPELRALVAAVGSDRTIEARLTGGFAHGALRGPVRAGEPAAETVSPDVRIAAATIEKRVAELRSPQNLRALGIAELITGNYAQAVPILEEAADQPNPDAHALSDLAAAYLARATRADQSQDLAKALAVADRATTADPVLAEAWFNRACALEHLGLADQAVAAWREYLKVDSRSPWADEAPIA